MMQSQFQYIVDLAKHYNIYSDQPEKLFDAMNNLQKNVLEEIYKEFGDPDREFKPVNLLRAEVARRLLMGESVSEILVEDIKNRIRAKDVAYFDSYKSAFLKQLAEYELFKRDLFANWQNNWSVFYSYFYRGTKKETVLSYLDQIACDLLKNLDLKDYTFHKVDFQGPSNFGSSYCWIALYPITKESHKESYQFFVRLSATSESGRMAGHSIKNAISNQLKKVSSYIEALNSFKEIKDEILKLNKSSRNFFKFAPGSQASEWLRFYDEGVAAINYSNFNIGDISEYNSRDDINKALGLPQDSPSNQAWNLWLFKSAKIGDVVFASKGVNTCFGIGVIEGNYYYDKNGGGYNHKRKINWLTDKTYQYKSDTLKGTKNLFRADTFSPTKNGAFLLSEYAKSYPELISAFEKYDIKDFRDLSNPSVDAETVTETESGVEENVPICFWWMNANPKIWKISNYSEGQRQTYTTHNEKGNKRRIYKYFEAAKPGDLIIGYESTPTKQIKAIYEITKGIHQLGKEEVIEFELIEKLEIPIHWDDFKTNPSLQNCEVLINNQGSLFKLTEDEFDIFREVIDNKNIITEKFLYSGNFKKYKFSEDNDKPFISEAIFLQTVNLLKRKKNIILQGPPGVGKTFIARKLAYEIMQEVKDGNIEMVQFHQSYSYEDFIQGLRPTQKGGFDLKNGIFYSFCQRAMAHPDKPFFFVIDEINRGNLSKIFGELMMLIEADKRDEKFALKLTYAEDDDSRFYVPDNLYIIGTMNTSDRSLAIVDYALRRRFAFVTLQPDYGDNFRSFLSANGLTTSLIEHICSSIIKLNTQIKNDINLGEGFQIGHSYFCSNLDNEDESKWWNEILNFELKPLLEEIWFDDSAKVLEILKQLSR